LLRVGSEAFHATHGAEIVGTAFVIVFGSGGFRHDLHFADRIGFEEHEGQ
jgi:hypothetical protein